VPCNECNTQLHIGRYSFLVPLRVGGWVQNTKENDGFKLNNASKTSGGWAIPTIHRTHRSHFDTDSGCKWAQACAKEPSCILYRKYPPYYWCVDTTGTVTCSSTPGLVCRLLGACYIDILYQVGLVGFSRVSRVIMVRITGQGQVLGLGFRYCLIESAPTNLHVSRHLLTSVITERQNYDIYSIAHSQYNKI